MIVPPQWYHLEWLMWFVIGSTITSLIPDGLQVGDQDSQDRNVDEGHDFAGFVD